VLRAVLASGALILSSSCVYQQFADTCDHFSGVFFYSIEPTDYTLFISAPQVLEKKPPTLAFGDSDTSSLTVRLVAVESGDSTHDPFTESRCSSPTIGEYELVVDKEDWITYWENVKEEGSFSIGVGVPGLEPPIRDSSFGFAFVEKSSRNPAASCGCLAP